MKLGEALQNLFHTETEEAQEQEEIELSEEDAEEYEEDIEELAEEDAGPVMLYKETQLQSSLVD
jgi:hypothetical protein